MIASLLVVTIVTDDNIADEQSDKSMWLFAIAKKRKRIKNWIKYGLLISLSIYLILCFSMCLSARETTIAAEDGMLYYVVNADGMKGLGHSIVLLVDKDGCGTVISFNGMQRSLIECLLGKSGVGKMSIGTMTKEETIVFLQTGDLKLDKDQLTDNYDMALYRPITMEEYHILLEQIAPYLMAEQKFANLYEKWALEEDTEKKKRYKQELEYLGQDTSLPLYQIYTNNCDHVARLLIRSIDSVIQEYSQHTQHITPNGNLKAFAKKAKNWGVMTLGTQSIQEVILMFLMIF